MYLLRKRTVEVYLPGLSTRPQEPRRPRFSFFQSSQCQRTDPGYVSRRRRRWKLGFQNSRTKILPRLPGSSSVLSVVTEQWEQRSRSASSVGRCIRAAPLPVNTPDERKMTFLSPAPLRPVDRRPKRPVGGAFPARTHSTDPAVRHRDR